MSGNATVEEVTRLIREGADVNAVNESGLTPLMVFAAWFSQDPEPLRVLIENGADVNAASLDGKTPLMIALDFNTYFEHLNFATLQLLIDSGADVNAADNNGNSPLLFAMDSADFDVIRLLIENGADVNAAIKRGAAPFMRVVYRNQDILRLLVENGADINLRDRSGKRALDYAEVNEKLKESYPDDKYTYDLRGDNIGDIDFKSNPVKLLAVDGIYPSEENIRSGTYPFTVDLFAVTAGTANPHAQALIDWLLSPQGQELVEKAGYVPIMSRQTPY